MPNLNEIIPFWMLLLVIPVALVIELFVAASALSREQQTRSLRVVWRILGVAIPALWLFLAPATTVETTLILLTMWYFAFRRPANFARETKKKSESLPSETQD